MRPLRRAAALALCCGLLACSGGDEEIPTLRVCLEGNPRDLDPRFGSDENSRRAHALLHAGLVRHGADGAPLPDLAESWEVLTPTRYRFLLRDGLRFSDGTSLTAEDVRATLLSVAQPDSRSFRHGDLRVIESVQVLSPVELEVVLSAPFAPLLANLNLGILPRNRLSSPENAPPSPGAGPYRLVSFQRDRQLLLEANEHFHEGPPALARIQLKILPDETTRALELKKGSLDLTINDLPPDLALEFQGDAEFQVQTSPGSSYAYLGFNLRDKALADVRVRRAIAMAIDREAIIEHLLRRLARPSTGMLPPQNWAYAAQQAPPHDPDAARALLEEAGFAHPSPDQPRLRLVYKTSTSELANQQAQVIQEQLRGVGIDVEIRSAEWATFYDDVVHGRFQLYSLTWTEIVDPDVLRLRFGSSYEPPEGLNRGGYRNPEIDRLLEEGVRRESADERRAIYADIQRILARELPYVSLWHRDNVAVARVRVRGLVLTPLADFRALKEVTLAVDAG